MFAEVMNCACGERKLVTSPQKIRTNLERLSLPLQCIQAAKARPVPQARMFDRHFESDAVPPLPVLRDPRPTRAVERSRTVAAARWGCSTLTEEGAGTG